ncbi:hypothetical protein [uncultured Gammaproteobacteria bacterium]|nr:hypothetical protein [uncultured Gammaproteobacteria bacterium]CAC9445108.1 hypothetical protein [uncultured Gammaproteobacteria bacterium]
MKHTTKSHVTLSSMSKHFFALSLLVAFSFNAFSVDNSQQTNKEAYLDLSKQQPTICHQKRQPSHDYTQRSRRCNSHRPRLYQRSKH